MNFETEWQKTTAGLPVDDSKNEKLGKSVDALAEFIRKRTFSVAQVAQYTFLPHHYSDHPIYTEVQGIISKEWTFFFREPVDEAVTMTRYALGLAALQVTDEDDKAATIFYLALKEPIKYLTDDHDSVFHQKILAHWKTKAEQQLAKYWAPKEKFEPKPLKAMTYQLPPDLKETLKKDIKSAASNLDVTISGVNATIAGEIIGQEALADNLANTIMASLSTMIEGLNKKLAAPWRTATSYHEEIQTIFDSAVRSEREGQLIWWLQSKYSIKAERNYRQMPMLEAALQMTSDFGELTPLLAPPEVDSMLLEGLWTTFDAKSVEQTKSLLKWIEEARNCSQRGDLSSDDLEHPLLLTELVKSAQDDLEQQLARLGLNAQAELNLADFTEWLWHAHEVGRGG